MQNQKKYRGKYFGTDGYRGEANESLSAENAFRVGRFLGWYYTERKKRAGKPEERVKVVIGKDTRRSSYLFEEILSAGLIASGADAYQLHVTTTPSVSYLVKTDGFDCGIMISASHNPYYDNGIKLLNAAGEKMGEEVTDLIEDYIEGELEAFGAHYGDELPCAVRDRIGRIVDYRAGRNRYMGYLISLSLCSYRGFLVGLDCANGSAWSMAKGVFDALGAKTYVINAEPNGTNINENGGSTHLEGLQRLVKEQKLDVGFAYDGDADRCLCVDENGNVVDGDRMLYIFGKYRKDLGILEHNTVVTTVMSNEGLYRAFDEIGISYEKTQIGDRFVAEAMMKKGYSLGGEQSGHIIFSQYATTGDGILTSIKMMEVLIETKRTLSSLAEEVALYPQIVKNIRVRDREAAFADEAVQGAIRTARNRLAERGRLLVRASGTEPVVRVMAESVSRELCVACVDRIADALAANGHTV